MKTYSVKEIATLLETNPETVRRWIRNGKLHAVQDSRKEGNLVTEDELEKFLKAAPKYARIAGRGLMTAMPIVGFPIVLSGLIGEMIVDRGAEAKARSARVSSEEIIKYLKKAVASRQEAIAQKREIISKLESEIEAEKKQIETLKTTISMIVSQAKEDQGEIKEDGM